MALSLEKLNGKYGWKVLHSFDFFHMQKSDFFFVISLLYSLTSFADLEAKPSADFYFQNISFPVRLERKNLFNINFQYV